MIYAEFTSIMTLELHEDVDFKLVIDPSNALMQCVLAAAYSLVATSRVC